MKKNIFAIDGLTASGKGTIAKKISKHFNFPYLNTGALYRAVGYKCKINNFENFDDITTLINFMKEIDFENDLENSELFTEEVGGWASKIAKISEVRNFLLKIQQDFCNKPKGAVLDGRDIGTIICPDAQYKFYITATAEERANRRYKEMVEKNVKADYNTILEQIKQRDFNDMNRAVAPLKKAEDAIEIDTTNLNPNEVLQFILKYVK